MALCQPTEKPQGVEPEGEKQAKKQSRKETKQPKPSTFHGVLSAAILSNTPRSPVRRQHPSKRGKKPKTETFTWRGNYAVVLCLAGRKQIKEFKDRKKQGSAWTKVLHTLSKEMEPLNDKTQASQGSGA
ncbi:hypothetical protein BDK51DRAFT_31335 [Blyttiomyces helicus]|uniref:Uncharacterized protein n=1 Tax=Blyttiomyces helicus TaxID=388810 RepID=A0A4P9WMY3_9FUNG|nr:hypothetical protein BDK51DRAFT_31335 [Blyttiomyces helicus]|eukprot:RKO93403.1 hypothetical protein BDK51DRAFT_31335 [Blyttiomyces helicus]